MKVSVRAGDFFIAAAAITVCGGELYGLHPFCTAMFCAMSTRVFFVYTAPIYILVSFLFTLEVWRLYAAAAAVFIMSAQWIVSSRTKRGDMPVWRALTSISAILVNAVLVGVFDSVMRGILTAAVGGLFYAFCSPAAGVLVDRFAAKPNGAENISLCFFLAAAGVTAGGLEIGGVRIGLAAAFSAVLFINALGTKSALAGATSVAVGLALKTDGVTAIAFAAGCGGAALFNGLPRYMRAGMGVMLYAAAAILLGRGAVLVGLDCAALAVFAVPYCALPKKVMTRLIAYFDHDGTTMLAVRHYINRARADCGNKLMCVASAFDESARLIGSFGASDVDPAQVAAALSDRFCPYCQSRAKCDIFSREKAFLAVADGAVKGKTVMGELPDFFLSDCVRTADVIAACTSIADGAKRAAIKKESERAAAEIVSERMTAVRDVLTSLGSEQALPVGFDGSGEGYVKSELALSGIECAEAFVTAAGVTAIVRSAHADKKRIERAVSTALKAKYEVRLLEHTQAAGWSVADLAPRPEYEAVYARAGVSRDGGISGDSYSFKRIGDKFLVALADGMGSGEKAGAGSDCAVELIECFYRAGFDSRSALTGVNRFLKLPGAERYSAADVAVCSLDSAAVDIIKLGSPPSYIKTADTVLRIDGGSLPIGVLDEMRPFTTVKRLYPGQMLIFVTDGVSDRFEGDELPDLINGLSAHNPMTAANDILSRALERAGGVPPDDMTVIAFRVYKRK